MARSIWDYSDILMSNRVGENLGAGIKQAGAAVADGMVRGQQIKDRRTRTQKVLETMDPDGAKSGKYSEASLGELEGALDSLAAMRLKERDAREAEAFKTQQGLMSSRQRQMDQDTAAAAQEYNALYAMRGAQGGSQGMFPGIPSNFAQAATALQKGRPAPASAGGSRAAAYVDAGGVNPQMIAALRSLEAQRPGFQLISDPVSGARLGVDSNGNASVITKPEKQPPPPSATKVDLGDGNFVYHLPGDKYLDKDMKPVLWAQPDSFGPLIAGDQNNKKPAEKEDPYKDAPVVRTQEDYDALKPGAVYVDASGAVKRKGAAK